MATKVEEILRSFEDLPEAEKDRLAAQILRWSVRRPQPPPSDDELVGAAEEIFLGLDRDEQGRG